MSNCSSRRTRMVRRGRRRVRGNRSDGPLPAAGTEAPRARPRARAEAVARRQHPRLHSHGPQRPPRPSTCAARRRGCSGCKGRRCLGACRPASFGHRGRQARLGDCVPVGRHRSADGPTACATAGLGPIGLHQCHCVGADRMRCSSSMARICVAARDGLAEPPRRRELERRRKTRVWAVACLAVIDGGSHERAPERRAKVTGPAGSMTGAPKKLTSDPETWRQHDRTAGRLRGRPSGLQ